MRVLLLEDDELMADLLETIIFGLYPGVRVDCVASVAAGVASWCAEPADMVLTDWNLLDGSGLSLVRTVRETNSDVPIVIVSGRSDRDSIRKAANLGVSGYILKPFSVELVHDRLSQLIDPGSVDSAKQLSLDARMRDASESAIQLPGTLDTAGVLALLEREDQLSPWQLAEDWKKQPALSARLLEVANRSSFRRSGKAVQSVKDAITIMGVPMAINQALALSLDVAGRLPDKRLRSLAQQFQAHSEQVGSEAQRLSGLLGGKGEAHYTAALLSRVGELVALKTIQQHLDAGNTLDDEEINEVIADWAQPLGNSVKVQWRLPIKIRELVGAIYMLPRDTVDRDRLVMRAAAMLSDGKGEDENCLRLIRRLGLSGKQGGSDGQQGNTNTDSVGRR